MSLSLKWPPTSDMTSDLAQKIITHISTIHQPDLTKIPARTGESPRCLVVWRLAVATRIILIGLALSEF
jgi:hypothetical protein